MPDGYAQRAPRVHAVYELCILAPVVDPSTGQLTAPVWQLVKIVELGEVLSKEEEAAPGAPPVALAAF